MEPPKGTLWFSIAEHGSLNSMIHDDIFKSGALWSQLCETTGHVYGRCKKDQLTDGFQRLFH